MTETLNDPESTRRQLQIQKLLEAINNYSPSFEEIEAMANAKKQMIKNIQKKFALSKVNLTFHFPYKPNTQIDSDHQDMQEIPQICNLKTENSQGKQNSKSKEKQRKPLQQKSSNKSETNLHSMKKVRDYSKEKQKVQSLFNNIQKVFKNGIKCQTPKVIKKQIVLTNKKQPSKENTKNQPEFNQQREELQLRESMNVKAKLKIKKPNNSLNDTKKHIHLRTQNNINFKHYNQCSNTKTQPQNFYQTQNQYGSQMFNQVKTQQKYVIYEEPSEESMFFNSRNNQNIDQNTHFEYPQTLFNVSDLKQKLRQTSNSKEKDFVAKHKRTATQGCTQIKIKLFNNSFNKNSCEKAQTFKKLLLPTNLFKKNPNVTSSSNLMNRTVSSLSQHSLKKGIKLCGKIDENGDRSLSKGSSNYQKIAAKKPKKHNISKLGKEISQQMPLQKDRKNFMSTHSFTIKEDLNKGAEMKIKKQESKEKNQENKIQKQNIEINRVSKINSIMTSLKEGYKVKNAAKSQIGIKTTVCR